MLSFRDNLELDFSFPTPASPFALWGVVFAWNDLFGDGIFIACDYEPKERTFVESFLREGMTAIDIGAHQGFYTLLLSLKVGLEVKVIAFELFLRERQKLIWNSH